ncbi:MAG: hypothetical protein AAGI45_14145 [Cyanobacteria bacterium P01_H01_bin.26]
MSSREQQTHRQRLLKEVAQVPNFAVGTIFVFAYLSNMLVRLVVSLRRPDRQIPVNSVMSAAELAGDLAGCVDGGPVDLSTNPGYMEEFGS